MGKEEPGIGCRNSRGFRMREIRGSSRFAHDLRRGTTETTSTHHTYRVRSTPSSASSVGPTAPRELHPNWGWGSLRAPLGPVWVPESLRSSLASLCSASVGVAWHKSPLTPSGYRGPSCFISPFITLDMYPSPRQKLHIQLTSIGQYQSTRLDCLDSEDWWPCSLA